jgi:transcription-repair coupling factor (superfamily II helicase)
MVKRYQEIRMNTDIITKDDYVPSNRERIRAYRDRLDKWLEQSESEAHLVELPVVVKESPSIANNISRFLRKGGAK